MFDFFSDMFTEIDKNFFRYQVNSGKEIAIEGYKSILYVDTQKVIIKLSNGELTVNGLNLNVKEFCNSSIVISGKILSVENHLAGEKHDKK